VNSEKFKRAVFIDRDGVINKEVEYLVDVSDFELLSQSAKAIRLLNQSDFLSIVVTNQSAVARGFCDISDIHAINKNMEIELDRQGAYLDAIYVCPCHKEGVNPKYKRDCNDRKPNLGMLEKSRNKFNLDLKQCYIVGDTTTDIMTGKNAGIPSILVNTGHSGRDKLFNVRPDYTTQDLFSAVTQIILDKET